MKMAQNIFPHVLYTFLDYVLDVEIERTILDCGAGGNFPKMALFDMNEFKTYGIEILEERVIAAENYAKEKNLNFHITEGDMRRLPYETESFGFAYSYNTIFHMNKEDIGIAINEMFRVVKKNGLIYVNLLSIDESSYGIGKEISPGIFMVEEGEEQIAHTYFTYDEGDSYFSNFEVLYKQIRIEHIYKEDYTRGMIDYIVRK
jgi:ubiquinone/menaquinone biosynthesis C-methylase UbiE